MYLFSFILLAGSTYTFGFMKVDSPIPPPKSSLQSEMPKEGARVHFIQLTNGEATLIQLENRKNILIDTGSYSSQRELFAYLEERNINIIHYLFITNEQDEHAGNVNDIVRGFQVDAIYFPYHLKGDLFQDETLDMEEETLHPLKMDKSILLDSNGTIKIFNPGNELSLSPKDNSLVFQFIHEENIFLFTSDISEKVETYLIKNYNLRSHILKVSDFGSNQSSHSDFLAEVDAHVAIIFHRPDFYLVDEILERLEEFWIDVYPIKKHGHIVIVSNNGDYETFIAPSKKDF
jgi:competence protein ComEC